MSNIDGRVSFDDDGESKFIQFSVLALMDIEEKYDCSIEQLPDILQGRVVRHEDGGLVPAPIRYKRDASGEHITDDEGNKVELPPEPPRLKEIVSLFRSGMLEYDDEISETEVAKMMSRIGVTKAGEMLQEAVIRAFPEANAAEDEEPKGNRQQRRASKSGNRKAAAKK